MPGIAGYFTSEHHELEFDRICKSIFLHYAGYTSKAVSGVSWNLTAIDPGIDSNSTFCFMNESIAISYFGKFYNSELHSFSSKERIAQKLTELYFEYGESFARHLNGSFVISIYDKRKNKLIITNDHYASCPLFFISDKSSIYFSPEIKLFKYIRCFDTHFNDSSIITFLVNGHLLNSNTFYSNVKPLRPASVLTYQDCNLKISTYEDYLFRPDEEDQGESYYVSILKDLLIQAVEERLQSPEETVIPISGGFDSRGILACAREVTDKKLKTVSWGINEDISDGDAYIGRMVASSMNTEHHFLQRIDHHFLENLMEMIVLTDGLNDDPVFHHNELNIMKTIRHELCNIHLLRGDECFGFNDVAFSDNEALARIGIYQLKEFKKIQRILKNNINKWINLSSIEISDIIRSTKMNDFTDRKDYYYFSQRLFHYLNRSSYYKMCVLDIQNPWLDKNILKFIQRVPTKYRYNKYLYKKTLQEMFPDIYKIPFASANSLENWDRDIHNNQSIRNVIADALSDDQNYLHSLIDYKSLRQLMKQIDSNDTLHNDSSIYSSRKHQFKQYLMEFPILYNFIKKIMLKKGVSRNIANYRLLMRFTQLSLTLNHLKTHRKSPLSG